MADHENDWKPAVADHLGSVVTRLASRLRADTSFSAIGVSAAQAAVLRSVLENAPTTAAYLANLHHVSPQAIAQSLARLKAAGLVRTRRDPGDRRRTFISAEPMAERLLMSLRDSRDSYLLRAVDQVVRYEERVELERAINLLERLASAHTAFGTASIQRRSQEGNWG